MKSTQSDNLKRDIDQILLGVYDYGRSIGQGISYKDDDFEGIDPTIACRGILKLVEKAGQEAVKKWITKAFGERCGTKDTEDFPELEGKKDFLHDGRCATCFMWECYDEELREEK